MPIQPSLVSETPAPIALERLQVQLPNGQRLGPRDAQVRVEIHHWPSLARLKAGQIGALAEDYVQHKVELHGCMRDIMAVAVDLLAQPPVNRQVGWWSRLRSRAHSMAAHTRGRDAAQIQFHYDVSDAFYALWLDPRRVYSCAYFSEADMNLAKAQEAKLEHICRKLMLKPGERFLDIGAGWGALLLWAAEHHGVDATGITLSRHQHAHVQRLIAEKGLQGRVRIALMDYRDLDESQPFDKIASVGMFEHVGRARMPAYFQKVRRLLKPGALLMNHGITAGGTQHRQLGAGMGEFIEKHIFPGGELLHVSTVLSEMADAGLEMVDTENLRPHYARTLWAWSDALEARLGEARRVLAAERGSRAAEHIVRAYRLYLAGCATGFEQGWISLHQMLATRPSGQVDAGPLRGAQSVYPFQRKHIYRAA